MTTTTVDVADASGLPPRESNPREATPRTESAPAGLGYPSFVTDDDVSRTHTALPELLAAEKLLTGLAASALTEDLDVHAEDCLSVASIIETVRRRLDALDAFVLARIETEGTARAHGSRNTSAYIKERFQLSQREAGQRDRIAKLAHSYSDNEGQEHDPDMPRVARALRSGELNTSQVAAIDRAMSSLPPTLRERRHDEAEEELLSAARDLQVADLASFTRHLPDRLDPGHNYPRAEADPRDRHVTVFPMTNGDFKLTGILDPATGATLTTALLQRMTADKDDPTSTHIPAAVDEAGNVIAVDIPVDDRTAGMKRHDRFARIVQDFAAGRHSEGAAYALVITASAEQVARGEGDAVTHLGTPINVRDAVNMGPGAVFYYQSWKKGTREVSTRVEHRFASPHLVALLTARDQGCTFPDCDMPAAWCDAHHVVPWAEGGLTELGNLTLVCSYHHHWHDEHGWRATMIHGLPAWIPPVRGGIAQQAVHHSKFRSRLRGERADSTGDPDPPGITVEPRK